MRAGARGSVFRAARMFGEWPAGLFGAVAIKYPEYGFRWCSVGFGAWKGLRWNEEQRRKCGDWLVDFADLALDIFENEALQVHGFGDGEEDGVVLGLGAAFEDAQFAAGVEGCGGDDLEQHGLADMV